LGDIRNILPHLTMRNTMILLKYFTNKWVFLNLITVRFLFLCILFLYFHCWFIICCKLSGIHRYILFAYIVENLLPLFVSNLIFKFFVFLSYLLSILGMTILQLGNLRFHLENQINYYNSESIFIQFIDYKLIFLVTILIS
jgi:hypothetical protein